jgi:hypothetical protein
MKKQMLMTMAVAVMLLLPLSSAFAAEAFYISSETKIWNPDKAYNGYNMWVSNYDSPIHLMDMEGRIVKRWENDNMTHWFGWLLENGNVAVMGKTSTLPNNKIIGSGVTESEIFAEKDWNNNIVVRVKLNDGVPDPDADDPENSPYINSTFGQHHDAQRVWNKALEEYTYLAIVRVIKNKADAEALGADPATSRNYSPKGGDPDAPTWSPCGVMEFTADGRLVWAWNLSDHYVTTQDMVDQYSAGTVMGPDETFTDVAGRTSRGVAVVATKADLIDYPGRLDTNHINGGPDATKRGPNVNSHHCNSFDYDEQTGYIAIHSKKVNEFFVIDHDRTFMTPAEMDALGEDYPGLDTHGVNWANVEADVIGSKSRGADGDFIYRFGTPANYHSGEKSYPTWMNEQDVEMYGSHDIQFIEPYHWQPPMAASDTWVDPAEYGDEFRNPIHAAEGSTRTFGNLLIFDNGCWNPVAGEGSRVLEINPFVDEIVSTEVEGTDRRGNPRITIVNVPYEPELSSGEIVPPYSDPAQFPRRAHVPWEFGGQPTDFFGNHISGADRMPNGNTVVCSGTKGHLFEVTDDGEVVWEYIIPHTKVAGKYVYATEIGPSNTTNTFRFSRYSPDHPGLAGQDLTPGSTLTGRIAMSADTYPEPPPAAPAPTGWGTSGLTAGEGGGGSAGGAGSGSGGVY